MKQFCFTTFICLICQLGLIQNGLAEGETSSSSPIGEPRYISDVIYVPLRSGQSNSHRILHKGLKSGTQVTLLEENEESGFSLVRTSNGIEGWLRSQYLEKSPTASIKLAEAQRTIQRLSSEAGPLSEQLLKAEAENQQLSRNLEQAERENNHLNKELERIKNLSANAVNLDEDNKNLLKQNEMYKNERDTLKAENQRLQEELKNDDLLNGAYILLLGIIATLVVQYFTNTKRRSEWA